MIGRRVSHYEIAEEISRGGMGVVYRAVDVNLGREVALKVLPEELVHDAERRDRLLHEARAASALEHPHIAVIHDVGDADGVTFIAMELIRGEKLSDTLARGPLSQPRAFTLATEIAEGLARAHEKRIIHRDLKPANVMVTEDGHAKIIDFGLAKLVEPPSDQAATASVRAPQTGAGLVVGTAAYMSPEQARGERVDHRTDVFALGATLYEMLTGRPAFEGRSPLDTMHAVLTQPVPPLPAAPGTSADVTADLQRMIAKCTEKEVADRYQGMKDLIVDLRAARRRLESSQSSPATRATTHLRAPESTGHRRRTIAAAVVLLAVAGIAAAVAWWRPDGTARTAAPTSGKPAVAVLYFANNTGDASLDWMRTGLTDMMVTDLSQSAEFEVMGTDRLVQILQELQRADDRAISADVIREVASRAGVDTVLVGSYVKAGGTIRISARLQEAQSGRILSAERVEGAGEASVFALIDELTRRVKTTMSQLSGSAAGSLLPRPGAPERETGLDRGVTEITTSSIEAYRYYADGISFHERGLPSQAAPLLEKAVEVDPDFAMAYAKLAVVNSNLGLLDKRDAYAKRALSLVDRLTTRERYYIEGFYYGLQPETRARSIEAYKQGLALHPEHQASRHNLGLQLMTLERFPEAIAQYDELLRRRISNPTTYENLAVALADSGDIARSRKVAEEFVRQQPDSATGPRTMGQVLTIEGRLDEARAAYEKSEALDPLDFAARIGKAAVALLQQRWADAHAVNEELLRSSSVFDRLLGLNGEAQLAGARGRGQEMLALWERAARLEGVAPTQRAAARNRLASALLRHGKPELGLAQAQLALADSRNRDQEFQTLQLLATAQAATGRKAESDKTLALLAARVKILPSDREVRRVHWARGEIALRSGDTATAVAELTAAHKMLPAHGPVLGPPSSHADLWFDAAAAHIRAGQDAAAAALLERLQSAHERTYSMEVYARSFFLLGRIYERRGDGERARAQFGQFVNLWRDGDLERGWMAEAEKKLAR